MRRIAILWGKEGKELIEALDRGYSLIYDYNENDGMGVVMISIDEDTIPEEKEGKTNSLFLVGTR